MDTRGNIRLAQVLLRRDHQQSSQYRRHRHHLHRQYQETQQEPSGRGEPSVSLPPAALSYVLPVYQNRRRTLEKQRCPRWTRFGRQEQKRSCPPRAHIEQERSKGETRRYQVSLLFPLSVMQRFRFPFGRNQYPFEVCA